MIRHAVRRDQNLMRDERKLTRERRRRKVRRKGRYDAPGDLRRHRLSNRGRPGFSLRSIVYRARRCARLLLVWMGRLSRFLCTYLRRCAKTLRLWAYRVLSWAIDHQPRSYVVLAGVVALLVVMVLGLGSCVRSCAHVSQQQPEDQSGHSESGGESTGAEQRTWSYPASLDPSLADELNRLGNENEQVAGILDNMGAYAHIGNGGESAEADLLKLLAKEPAAYDFIQGLPSKYPQATGEAYGETVTAGTVPILYQWDARWAYTEYCGRDFGATGCCPTALSMVYMAVVGKADVTPYVMGQLATSKGYTDDSSGTYGNFVDVAARYYKLTYRELGINAADLEGYLGRGYVMIASMGPGEFSTSGHFIVITGKTSDGKLIIHDPYSKIHTERSWEPSTIVSQMKRLHAFKLPTST